MFRKVATKSEIEEGKGKTIEIDGNEIAVFNVNGEFHAMDNTCTHRGGPLGEGHVEGDRVVCPWHGWRFDFKTGSPELFPNMKVKVYKVKVEGNDILVDF